MSTKTVFSLDLGTASIGWAVVSLDEEQGGEVIGLGVRSFEEPVEPKERKPKNVKRRNARMARRTTFRRKDRKKHLLSLLQSKRMAPSVNLESWLSLNPYDLRRAGTSSQLSLEELGRALYHICQRRGFLSNRKTKGLSETGIPEVDNLIELDESSDLQKSLSSGKKDEDSLMLASIAQLQSQLIEKGITLGSYLAELNDNKERIRSRHTQRSMYSEEFKRIWNTQSEYYPDILRDDFKLEIERAIFFQRPLRPVLRGKCQLEPNKPCTLRLHTAFQELRIWQTLANIRLTSTSDYKERGLSQEEKLIIAQALETTEKLSWAKFRKLLKVPGKDRYRINLEEGGMLALEGNKTSVALNRSTDGLWNTLDQTTKDTAQDILTSRMTDRVKLHKLISDANVNPETAYKLLIANLPDGTASMSLKAIKKILPHLKEGHDFYNARLAAGYVAIHEAENENLDILPWESLNDLRNPGVKKCVFESRKLVNALIRKYGKPDEIKIELARELGQNKLDRQNIQRAQRENELLNQQAATLAQENGIASPSRTDKLKYRLWLECNQTCPFTGKPISISELWTEKWHIEHIIPFSISLDDSFANKTLCESHFNVHVKKNQLPSQLFGADEQSRNAMLQRVGEFRGGRHKKKLFQVLREDLGDDFKARQLNDTRYASKYVRDYLKKLGIPVTSSTGKHTSDLRYQWGLHTVLSPDGDKNRMDHRHHAIDALVTGLTTPALVKRITELYKNGGSLQHGNLKAPLPWPDLRNQVIAAVDKMVVTHEPRHRVRGALHEETGYGHSKLNGKLTTRKPLVGLTEGEVQRIVDDSLREKVQAHIKNTDGKLEERLATFRVTDKEGVIHPVHRVQIYARGSSEDRYLKTDRGYFPSGANQWLIITKKLESEERNAHIVPLWRAAKLVHERTPMESLIPDGEEIIFVLNKNDMIELSEPKPGYFRVVKFSEENPVYLVCRPHFRADESEDVRIRTRASLQQIVTTLKVGMIDVK